ncbi:hypothetical protein JQ615_15325 [Bradyrhizobium jicamae]|uniref:Uncharacterized protein n=1 Tax=Bradyrhizobium jicamae TaxID=280332 RepID=A0ABS5FJ13_9BRAD|nr:hypothetical protein [Bradyrhizobium jicamae]MBR0796765.1 hypothetical protein [Bradyrhizobium jicamae]MBR0937541.1 hypothetical protein [Bradyrhizobium jicamae]
MTRFKTSSAGLIAIVMLTATALGGSTAVAAPHAIVKGHAGASYAGHWGDVQARMPMPRMGAFASTPRDEPGGVCDFGDNPAIC